MVKVVGELMITDFNHGNVPVDIYLIELDQSNLFSQHAKEAYSSGLRYRLNVSAYLPRSERVSSDFFIAYSDNKQELQQLVKEYFIPLYEKALTRLQGIVNGTDDCLFLLELTMELTMTKAIVHEVQEPVRQIIADVSEAIIKQLKGLSVLPGDRVNIKITGSFLRKGDSNG